MRTPLPRRTFLKAGAATLALPALDAMMPVGLRAEAKAKQPARMVLLHRGLGTYHPYLVPEKTGRDYAAPRYLKTLEAHRERFTLFSGVSHLGYPTSPPTSAATGICFSIRTFIRLFISTTSTTSTITTGD